VLAAKDCQVFIAENHPAFIDWKQFERNLKRLCSNPRRGPQPSRDRQDVSLLAGRVFCGRCGVRMQSHYARKLRYTCARRSLDYGEMRCCSLTGREIEDLAAEQILVALQPASLQLSLAATEQIERERAKEERHWQLRLERARQNADRAFRQYDSVEPENRLVARTLESHWEETLAEVRRLTEEYDRFRASRSLTLSSSQRRAIEQLSMNIPRLWNSRSSSVAEKRRVVELLIEKAVVTSHGDERVTIELHWSGGAVTQHEITRRVRTWSELSNYGSILGHIAELESRGCTSDEMATSLNQLGYQTCRGTSFTSANVRQLRKRAELSVQP